MSEPLVWNLVSGGYAEETVPHFLHYTRDALDLLGIGAESNVADVACGPGTLALEARQRGAQVRALDFAPDMLTSLQARAQHLGVEGVEAVLGDGQALPWPDASFDAAFSMFGLIFFPDRGAGLRELHRVLRPGGKALVASWVPFDRVPLMSATMESMREALPGMPFGGGKAPMGTHAEIVEEMSSAGFQDIRCTEVAHTMTFPDLESYWAGMLKSLAPLVLLRHRMGDAFESFQAQTFENLRAKIDPSCTSAVLTANFGIGTKA